MNINTDCPEKYFRTALEILFFDDFNNRLKENFTNYKKIISSLYLLLSNKYINSSIKASDLNLYLGFLDFYSLSTELNLGKRNWSDTPERPTEVLEVYSNSR